MGNRPFALALCSIGLVLAGCAGSDSNNEQTDTNTPELDTLIDLVIEAYGGLERLEQVQGYRMTGQLRAVQRQQDVATTRWFGRPDQLMLELRYPDHSEYRLTKGVRGWKGPSPADLVPAHPTQVQAMRLQTLRLDFPLRLDEHRSEVENLGRDAAGRSKLRLQVDELLHITWHVDRTSYRVSKVSLEMAGPPAMTFSAEYSQFHMISGVLVAFHERTFAGDTQTAEFQTTDFELDPPALSIQLVVPGEI
jgi:hypothetical protein